jgi:hypothetical protein
MKSLLRNIFGLAVVVALGAGCTSTIAGSAVKAPRSAGGDDVDASLLNSGNFPTAPLPPLGVAGDRAKGSWAEGRRMAPFVVGPWEADPSLINFEWSTTVVIKNVDAINAVLDKPIGEPVPEHNSVAGFASGRHTLAGAYKRETNLVLEFASPADASAAAGAMAAKGKAISALFDENPILTQPVPIPRYPRTAAVTYRYDDPQGPRFRVVAITAHGPYVLAQGADSTVDAADAARLIATTLDLQGPRIDKFVPTPLDRLAQLSLDPSGLMARTLPPPQHGGTVNDGIYDQSGILHFQDNPPHGQALFKSVGLQQASYTGDVTVYQAGDSDAAARIEADFATEAVKFNKLRPAPGVPGMPAAKCFAKQVGFYCVAGADKYAFEVQSVHEDETHQRVAAEYRMLTGK